MSAPRKNFSRPSSSVADSPQDHPSFYPMPNAASSHSHLAPPTAPFAGRRKRTSSLPASAQRMQFPSEHERGRTSTSGDRPRHLTAPRSASKLSNTTSRDEAMAYSSPSSSSMSSSASRSPKWYQRWFGVTPTAPTQDHSAHRSSADSTPRTLSKRTRRMSVASLHQKYSYSAADAPPLPQNPYWREKADGVNLVKHAAEAGSAGDDYAW